MVGREVVVPPQNRGGDVVPQGEGGDGVVGGVEEVQGIGGRRRWCFS